MFFFKKLPLNFIFIYFQNTLLCNSTQHVIISDVFFWFFLLSRRLDILVFASPSWAAEFQSDVQLEGLGQGWGWGRAGWIKQYRGREWAYLVVGLRLATYKGSLQAHSNDNAWGLQQPSHYKRKKYGAVLECECNKALQAYLKAVPKDIRVSHLPPSTVAALGLLAHSELEQFWSEREMLLSQSISRAFSPPPPDSGFHVGNRMERISKSSLAVMKCGEWLSLFVGFANAPGSRTAPAAKVFSNRRWYERHVEPLSVWKGKNWPR